MVRVEAGVYDESLSMLDLDLDEASALYANKTLSPQYALSGWWEEALSKVKQVPSVPHNAP